LLNTAVGDERMEVLCQSDGCLANMNCLLRNLESTSCTNHQVAWKFNNMSALCNGEVPDQCLEEAKGMATKACDDEGYSQDDEGYSQGDDYDDYTDWGASSGDAEEYNGGTNMDGSDQGSDNGSDQASLCSWSRVPCFQATDCEDYSAGETCEGSDNGGGTNMDGSDQGSGNGSDQGSDNDNDYNNDYSSDQIDPCLATGCMALELIGDNICDNNAGASCYNAECAWDGGDCGDPPSDDNYDNYDYDDFSMCSWSWEDCSEDTDCPDHSSGETCDAIPTEQENEACLATGCENLSFLGDEVCDPACYNEECEWDFSDCDGQVCSSSGSPCIQHTDCEDNNGEMCVDYNNGDYADDGAYTSDADDGTYN
jgi:hypothetical protein